MLEYLSVFYPPVSVEKAEFQNLYVRKGEGLVVPCLMKDRGFPAVRTNLLKTKIKLEISGKVCGLVEGWHPDEK